MQNKQNNGVQLTEYNPKINISESDKKAIKRFNDNIREILNKAISSLKIK